MAYDAVLIHATGLGALALNVIALLLTCEKRLRLQSGLAGVIWACNHLLLGAHTAAVLSLLSAGRTATSAATLDSSALLRRRMFAGFVTLTLAISAATWNGWPSALLAAASLMSTYAMFYLRGRALRWSMVAASALWMHNAWVYGSWEQMAANGLTAAAAVYGMWRVERSAGTRNPFGTALAAPADAPRR